MVTKEMSYKDFIDSVEWVEIKPKDNYAYKELTICETCIHFEVCDRALKKEARAVMACSDYSGICMTCKFYGAENCMLSYQSVKDTDFCSCWSSKEN